MSTLLSSVAFDEINQQKASILEVDFARVETTNVKAKNGLLRNSFSNGAIFTESAIEISGRLIVSF